MIRGFGFVIVCVCVLRIVVVNDASAYFCVLLCVLWVVQCVVFCAVFVVCVCLYVLFVSFRECRACDCVGVICETNDVFLYNGLCVCFSCLCLRVLCVVCFVCIFPVVCILF